MNATQSFAGRGCRDTIQTRVSLSAIAAGQVRLIDFPNAGPCWRAVDFDIGTAHSQCALDGAAALIRYREVADVSGVVLNSETTAPLISDPSLKPMNPSVALCTRNSNGLADL